MVLTTHMNACIAQDDPLLAPDKVDVIPRMHQLPNFSARAAAGERHQSSVFFCAKLLNVVVAHLAAGNSQPGQYKASYVIWPLLSTLSSPSHPLSHLP